MAYTSNKQLPKIRREAARLVRKGWSTRKVARHFGYSQSVIVKWTAKAREIGDHPIPTKSSRPRSHPRTLPKAVTDAIVSKRLKRHRYAEAIHQELKNDGVVVSVSSVKRTLDRKYLLKKKSLWKRYHPHQDRPYALKPGDLVQTDTIHRMVSEKKRLYVFTLIDVYSRIAYAKSYERMSAAISLKFIREAQCYVSFTFAMIQSDHGPEFGMWFVSQLGIAHRYTRVGKPNDNAHIERFNRTLQEECLDTLPNNVRAINRGLKVYLKYYNHERVHGGISFRTPIQLAQ
jgi:transposase InsO family protein